MFLFPLIPLFHQNLRQIETSTIDLKVETLIAYSVWNGLN